MRQFILALFFLGSGPTCISQTPEFNKSATGLIYPDSTIKKLKHIVDSLNLKFKVCDLNKVYQSKLQAKANFVSLKKDKINEAKKDIESNIPYEDFIRKYPNAEKEEELLIVKFKYKDYEDKDIVEFSSVELGSKGRHELEYEKNIGNYDKPLKGKWIYKYYKKTDYSAESIKAFYFTEELTHTSIPVTYAKMIQYSDCLVDTSTQIFYDKARRSGVRYISSPSSILKEFMDYVHKSTNRPEYQSGQNEKEQEIYWQKYQLWDSVRILRLDSIRQKDEKFNTLLQNAVKDALTNGGTNDEFEEYVERYYSPNAALELKRNRIVVGGCSMDNSPRIHAFNIAILSAETTNWEIFLRSHLDIMNDKFERASDGSYAWGQRKTYIRELEVLDINVPDLLLGISLRIENPANNHYYGNIGRLGRALAETDKSDEIETKILQMISDNQLDDYNRIILYYLFLNYNYNLENKERQVENKVKLQKAVNTLPDYLAKKITVE
ncbi:hypothetical protein [Longitalea luteola]|uniref:hypothetical protein n=1 Tax=Longitalea luteola TaxID=2812563 RepID=UPI001A964470|nr:hypothetical protein [Longitalea luteola]